MARAISKKRRCGKLITNGVTLELHEQKTVNFLLMQGINIELIQKSNRHGTHTPDIKIQGLEWEMKSPKGAGKYLIQNTLHRAAHQSSNIIVDLCRIKIHQSRCLQELEKTFHDLKRLKRLKVITKSRKVLDYYK